MRDAVCVIITYNSARHIRAMLDTVPAALDGVPARVVVVDNASTDGTPEVVASRPDVLLIRAPNRGYAAGLNRGVRASDTTGPIAVLNPDIRLEPGCLRILFDRVVEPGVGIAVPKLFDDAGRLSPSIRREPTLMRSVGLGFTGHPRLSEPDNTTEAHERSGPVDWATGAVMAVSRACYDLLKGWDESFFLYSEETDFCLRSRDAGLVTVFEPQAVAVHVGGQSGAGPRIYTMQIVNRVRLYRRRHSALASWAYFGTAIAREAARATRGHKESRAALWALLRPGHRPSELGSGARRLVPQ